MTFSPHARHALIALVLTAVTFLTLELRSLPVTTRAQTPPTIERVASIGGKSTALDVAGPITYVGQGTNVIALDTHDPASITQLSSVMMPDYATALQAVGTRLYVANGPGGFVVFDTTNPSAMTILGSYHPSGAVTAMKIVGTTAYLIVVDAPTSWLMILDVSNPANPALQSTFQSPNRGFGHLDVDNGVAYVTAGSELTIIDVSNPTQPVLKSVYSPFLAVSDVVIADGIALVVGSNGFADTLQTIDISDPAHPAMIGVYSERHAGSSSFNFKYARVRAINHTAYVIARNIHIDVIDYSHPETPAKIGEYDYSDVNDLQVTQDGVYTAASYGIRIFDRANPSSISPAGTYHLVSNPHDVEATMPYVYASDGFDNFDVLDASNLRKPVFLAATDHDGPGYNFEIAGNYLYVNRYNYGFEIYNTADPAFPVFQSAYNPVHGSYSTVTVKGSYAYIAELLGARGTGINILDISDPASIKYVSTVDNIPGAMPEHMRIAGHILSIAAGGGGLVNIDIADPQHPMIIGRYTAVTPVGVDVDGDLVFVTSGDTLSILDNRNPSAPVLVGTFQAPGAALGPVSVVQHHAYVGDAHGGLLIVDVSDPANPTLYSRISLPVPVINLHVAGNVVLLATGDGGLQILQTRGLPDPTPTASSSPTATSTTTPTPTATVTAVPTATPSPTTTQLPMQEIQHHQEFLPVVQK